MNSPELLLKFRDVGPAVAAAEGLSWLEEASLRGKMHPGGQTSVSAEGLQERVLEGV